MQLMRAISIGLMAIGAIFAQPVAFADAADAFLRKGNQLYEQATHGKELDEKKLKQSIEAYQEALRRNPKPLIKYNLGTAQARLRQYQEAQQTLSEATESPDVSVKHNSNFNLGVATGKPVIDQLQSQKSQPPPEQMEKTLKKLEDSMKAFRNVIVDSPDDIDAIYNYEVTKKAYNGLKQKQDQSKDGKSDQKNGKGQQKDKQGPQDKNQQGQQGQQDKNQQNQQGQQQQNQQGQQQDQQKQDQQGQQQNQQGKQDQKDEQKQGQDTKQGEKKDEQKQQENGGLEEQKRDEQKGNKPDASPSQSAGGEGERATKPMNPDQMDAMRLLNLLEKEKPQQYKRLFQFRGNSDRKLQKDW